MKRMSNSVSQQEWEALRYPVTLRQLSADEGGGWLATIPLLGEAAFTADGETAIDALESLEALRRDLYDDVIASGQPIPIPQDVTDEKNLPSGRWIMRTSPQLHAEIQEAAKAAGMSLNAYCNHALERGHAVGSMHRAAQEFVQVVASATTSRMTQPTPAALAIPSQAGWAASQEWGHCLTLNANNKVSEKSGKVQSIIGPFASTKYPYSRVA